MRLNLTDVQTGFVQDGARALEVAQQSFQARLSAVFVELAKLADIDPSAHKAELVNDGGKLAFEVRPLNRNERRRQERDAQTK